MITGFSFNELEVIQLHVWCS